MSAVLSIVQLPKNRTANRSELAEFFECPPQSIDDWVRAGMPCIKRPTPEDKGWLFDIKAAMQWKFIRQYGVTEDEVDPKKLAPKERKDWYDSELKKIQLEEKTGKLIPSDEVERVTSEAYGVIAHSLRSMPDNMERDLNITGKQAEYLETNINKHLEALHKSLSKLNPNAQV